MELLSIVALILLTMVGYSSGVTVAGRGRHVMPTGLLLGIVVGVLFTAVRLTITKEAPIIPESELPVHARETAVAPEASFGRKLWLRWTAFATRMGGVQGRLFMGYFYFIIVTLFGLGMRIFSDPLHMKRPFHQSGWSAKDVIDSTVEAAREQG